MAESSLKMDMNGWLTVAPRLESVNRPAAFLPCCKKFKLMWHSGHVGARHAQWFMPLIFSRGHFKWKHREFANFTVRHCRGNSCIYLVHCWEKKQRRQKTASVKSKLTNYLLVLSDEHSRPTATQTKQQVQKTIYVIAVWTGCALIYKAIKDVELKGTGSRQGR